MAAVDYIPGFIARSDFLKSLWENGSVAFDPAPTVTPEQRYEAAARFVAGIAAGAAAGIAVTTSTSLIRLGLAISGKSWEARMLPVLGGVYGGMTTDAIINALKSLNLGIEAYDLIDKIKREFTTAETTRSPITLDLNGDGITTTGLQDGAYFDHDGNGFAEATGWVNAQDGILVRDLDGNGTIDTGRELFGSETLLADGQKAANGYQALAELDTNHDGQIDLQDAAYTTLKIWKDANGDGYSSAGELYSLADAGVQSIATGYTAANQTDANGNTVNQTSTFTRTDGSTGNSADIWFDVNKTNTIATDWLPETAAVAALPDLQGSGNVYDLHQAMLRDTTGHLQDLVQQFIDETDPAARRVITTQLIYAWAGVENIDPASRAARIIYGNAIGDARKLASLEAILGEAYLGTWCWGERDPNPHGHAAPILLQAFDELADSIYSQLMAQTHFKPLLDSIGMIWDAATNQFDWDVSGTVAALQSLFDADPAGSIIVFDEFANTLELSGDSGTQVLDALRAQGDSGGGFAGLLGIMGIDKLVGDNGNNVLVASGGNNELFTGAGNDTLTDIIRVGKAANDFEWRMRA